MLVLTVTIIVICCSIAVFEMYLVNRNRWRAARMTCYVLAVVLALAAIVDWSVIGPGAIFFSFFSLCISGICACAEFDVRPK